MAAPLNSERWCAVVPIGDLRDSKSRLSPMLDSVERAEFTLVMARDVLEALRGVKSLDGIVVVSSDSAVQELARQFGCSVWSQRANDLNEGLRSIADALSRKGVGVMIVPCDVPAARANDYWRLLEAHRKGITLVRASTDGGTNALINDAGVNLPFHYGRDSFRLHSRLALERGIPLNIASVPRLARDIDRPEDIDWLIRCGWNCLSRDYLLRLGSVGNSRFKLSSL